MIHEAFFPTTKSVSPVSTNDIGGVPHWWVVTPQGVVTHEVFFSFNKISFARLDGPTHWWVVTPQGVVTHEVFFPNTNQFRPSRRPTSVGFPIGGS